MTEDVYTQKLDDLKVVYHMAMHDLEGLMEDLDPEALKSGKAAIGHRVALEMFDLMRTYFADHRPVGFKAPNRRAARKKRSSA